MSLNKYYEDALTYEEYMDLLGEYLPLHQLHYKKFTISDEWLKNIKLLNSCRVLVITEPWCGDSLASLPVVRKICEASDWELKIILRDKNPELIDQYLTNGGRAIPIFLFLDHKGDLVLKWGPRPQPAQAIFENHREQINTGQIEKKEVIKNIRTFYAKNRGEAIYKELMQILSELQKNKRTEIESL